MTNFVLMKTRLVWTCTCTMLRACDPPQFVKGDRLVRLPASSHHCTGLVFVFHLFFLLLLLVYSCKNTLFHSDTIYFILILYILFLYYIFHSANYGHKLSKSQTSLNFSNIQPLFCLTILLGLLYRLLN